YQPVSLPEITLPLSFNLQAIELAPVTIALADAEPITLQSVQLAANGKQHRVAISQLSVTHQDFALKSQAEATWSGDYPHSLSLSVNSNHKSFAQQKLKLNSSGAISDLHVKLDVSGPMRAKAELTVDLTSAALPLHLQASWQNLHWP